MEFMEKGKQKDVIADMKKELIEGSFEKAVMLQRDSKLQVSEVTSIANTALSELFSQKKCFSNIYQEMRQEIG